MKKNENMMIIYAFLLGILLFDELSVIGIYRKADDEK